MSTRYNHAEMVYVGIEHRIRQSFVLLCHLTSVSRNKSHTLPTPDLTARLSRLTRRRLNRLLSRARLTRDHPTRPAPHVGKTSPGRRSRHAEARGESEAAAGERPVQAGEMGRPRLIRSGRTNLPIRARKSRGTGPAGGIGVMRDQLLPWETPAGCQPSQETRRTGKHMGLLARGTSS